jgi:hypothetical protein
LAPIHPPSGRLLRSFRMARLIRHPECCRHSGPNWLKPEQVYTFTISHITSRHNHIFITSIQTQVHNDETFHHNVAIFRHNVASKHKFITTKRSKSTNFHHSLTSRHKFIMNKKNNVTANSIPGGVWCNTPCYDFLNYLHYCLNHASNPLVKQILIN